MKDTDQRDFYSSEAASYETKRYGSRYGTLFRQLQRDCVVRVLETHGIRPLALDVATGTGQLLPVLARAAGRVVATDLTPAMLSVARKNLVVSVNIDYCVASAFHLPYLSSMFDVVTSSRFLHLFESEIQAELVVEMARVLKPGGTLVIDFYSADARRMFAPAIWLYRKILRKRPENDYRVSISAVRSFVANAGMNFQSIEGVGNFLLIPFIWLPQSVLKRLGTFLGKTFPFLSEQFVVTASKP